MGRKIVHRGRKIQVAVDTWVAPDGHTVTRDVIMHPGAVAVIPVVDARHICLLKNERPVVEETLWEIPAGTLEPNEPPEVAALRELAEETGYRAAKLERLATIIPSPGVLNERIHLFVASKLTPGKQELERDEDLEVEIVSFKQALAWALDGTIEDAKTLIALLLWEKLQKVKSAPSGAKVNSQERKPLVRSQYSKKPRQGRK
jgi:ADP-ribose pyrophosphatase